MARNPERRYPDMGALAADLSAYVEHRVVRAYETGAVAELRKWVERNRGLAAALASALALLVAGLAASLAFKARSDRNARLARENEQRALAGEALAKANEERALAGERLATEQADDVLRLSALQDLEDLIAAADRLWPAHPENVGEYEDWLREARRIAAELPAHESKLAELRSKTIPWTEEQQAQAERLEAQVPRRPEWNFADGEDKWWHNQLEKLVVGLKEFSDEEAGLLSAGRSEKHGWGILRRLEFAHTIEERSVGGEDAVRRWSAACASIADPSASPAYGGLRIGSQLGLLPIGRDPESGLWEFAHLQTGEPAERDADEKLVLREETGLVFVLLPGGTFWMGAQAEDPAGENYDPEAKANEGPVHEVTLSPFFLSKYEMTQGQWERLGGHNPSYYQGTRYSPKWNRARKPWSALHPVEQVSWVACDEVLGRLELSLPTEAQWEYGARAGTSTPWWPGEDPSLLAEAANLADAHAKANGGPFGIWESWDDGNTSHAAVGAYRANPFGLHDVFGNVWEWCQDWYTSRSHDSASGKDPLAALQGSSVRVERGGSFANTASNARSALRGSNTPALAGYDLGLRPARRITP
jgi:formylglycine-generating enzyme required for sulfatase activity